MKQTIALDIAGTRIDIRHVELRAAVTDRYLPFARAAGAPGWIFVLGPDWTGRPSSAERRVDRRGSALRIRGLEGAGYLDTKAHHGVVSGDPFHQALNVLLRAAVQLDVAERGGFLVHASAVLSRGVAHLFAGPSGAGKSTVAARARCRLADEICAVVPSAGGFLVYATPWWGGRPEPAPLGGIYSLARGVEEVTPLGAGAALRHLLGSVVLPLDGPAERRLAFVAAGRVARSVPFARFAFRLDSDVDALLVGSPGTAA